MALTLQSLPAHLIHPHKSTTHPALERTKQEKTQLLKGDDGSSAAAPRDGGGDSGGGGEGVAGATFFALLPPKRRPQKLSSFAWALSSGSGLKEVKDASVGGFIL